MDDTQSQAGGALRAKLGVLTDEELCALLCWAPATLRNRRSAGTAPPSSKVGRLHLTSVAQDLEPWLRRRRVARAAA